MSDRLEINVTAIEQRHKDRLEPRVKRGIALVSGKLEDARAHAENAVTNTLRGTQDGRLSAGVLRQNPSVRAAISRLDELWSAIGGASVTALSGFVQDSSAAFYRDSRDLWWNNIRPEYRVDSKDITASQDTYVRGLLWFGVPIRKHFEAPIARSKTTMLQALHQAGSTEATTKDGYLTLQAWQGKTRDALIRQVGLALVDASMRADRQAMNDTLAPQYRPKQ